MHEENDEDMMPDIYIDLLSFYMNFKCFLFKPFYLVIILFKKSHCIKFTILAKVYFKDFNKLKNIIVIYLNIL